MKVKDIITQLEQYNPQDTIAIGYYDADWVREEAKHQGINLADDEVEEVLEFMEDNIGLNFEFISIINEALDR